MSNKCGSCVNFIKIKKFWGRLPKKYSRGACGICQVYDWAVHTDSVILACDSFKRSKYKRIYVKEEI